jgi:hypothetical protein
MAHPSRAPALDEVISLVGEALRRNRSVDRIVFDPYAIMLHFFENGPTAYLRISSSFEWTSGGATEMLDPELGGSTLQPTLALLGARLLRTSLADSGDIRLEFRGGLSLHVRPHPTYEAWEVQADDWFKVVCVPGGSLAAWTFPVPSDPSEDPS